MYAVSDEFNKRVKQSHAAVSRVDVYNGTTPLVEGLSIERGYVHADNAAANRRRCDIVIGDPDLTPQEATDLLHPLSGNELHVYRGLSYTVEGKDNLLSSINSTFETDGHTWTPEFDVTISRSSEQARTGSWSLKAVPDVGAGDTDIWSPKVTAADTKQYDLEVWAYCSTSIVLTILASWYTGASAIGDVWGPNVTLEPNTWTLLKFSRANPIGGADGVRLSVDFNADAEGQSVYFDDAVIRELPSETEELVPQGVFGIEDCDVDDQGESISISVKGFDRSKRVQRARWTDLFFIAQGTNVATAIRNILTNRMPSVDIAWVDSEVTTETTPPLVYGYGGWSGGGDPWEHASKLAESIGYELYFGVEGRCQLTPVPDPATDPVVWTYREGPDNLLLFGSRQLTRDNVFNHVIAFGLNTSTDTPIRVEATDDNPNSPTYINGPFGDVPTYYRSTLLLTATQAQAAAEALLREKLGTPEQVRFISVVHPGHDIGDVVQIERERAGITGTHVIDKLSIPLGAMESMNATCRERRT